MSVEFLVGRVQRWSSNVLGLGIRYAARGPGRPGLARDTGARRGTRTPSRAQPRQHQDRKSPACHGEQRQKLEIAEQSDQPSRGTTSVLTGLTGRRVVKGRRGVHIGWLDRREAV